MKVMEKMKIQMKILRISPIITAHYFAASRENFWLNYCTADPEKQTSTTAGRRNINVFHSILISCKYNDKVGI